MCRSESAAENDRVSAREKEIHARRNQALGISAGAVGRLGRAFLHPEFVVIGLISTLTGSPYLIALVAIINKAGILMPQLWASSLLEHKPRKMPYFKLATAVRAAGFAVLVLSIYLMGRSLTGAPVPVEAGAGAAAGAAQAGAAASAGQAGAAASAGQAGAAAGAAQAGAAAGSGGRAVGDFPLVLFFLGYAVVCGAVSIGHVTFVDMVGRMIPSHRVGMFFGARNSLGNLAAILAGYLVVHPFLAKFEVPTSYLFLALIGSTLTITDMFLWTRATEVVGRSADNRTTLRESLRRGRRWLRGDHNYRMFFWARLAFRINYLNLVFFIPYGKEQLTARGGEGMELLGGIFVGTLQVARVVASATWGRIADRRGYRSCLIGGSACFLAAPLLALLAPRLPKAFALPLPGVERTVGLPLAVYILALLLLGFAFQGSGIGFNHFVVSSAPEHRRPSYIGFVNTISSPLTLLPLLAAPFTDRFGMRVVPLVALCGALIAVASSLRMKRYRTSEGPPESSAGAD